MDHKRIQIQYTEQGEFTPEVLGNLPEYVEAFQDWSLLVAAAGVYKSLGTLDYAASILDWAGFQPHPSWAEEDDTSNEDILRRWLEKDQDRIMLLASSPQARAIASGQDFSKYFSSELFE